METRRISITSSRSIFVFYSGHGSVDEVTQMALLFAIRKYCIDFYLYYFETNTVQTRIDYWPAYETAPLGRRKTLQLLFQENKLEPKLEAW